MKEADEHVRFAVPQAVPPPVYRTACHGHVSLYVTANKPAGGKNKTQIKHFPGSGLRVVGCKRFVFCFVLIYVLCFVQPCHSIPKQNPAPDLYHVPDPISPTHDTFRRGKLPSHNGHKIDALDDAMPPGAAAWQGWQHAPFYCGTLCT